jgi:hypothetical protein
MHCPIRFAGCQAKLVFRRSSAAEITARRSPTGSGSKNV